MTELFLLDFGKDESFGIPFPGRRYLLDGKWEKLHPDNKSRIAHVPLVQRRTSRFKTFISAPFPPTPTSPRISGTIGAHMSTGTARPPPLQLPPQPSPNKKAGQMYANESQANGGAAPIFERKWLSIMAPPPPGGILHKVQLHFEKCIQFTALSARPVFFLVFPPP